MENEEKIIIRFENGEVKTIQPIEVKPAVDEYFREMTGSRFKKGDDVYTKVIKVLDKWIRKNGLHHPGAAGLLMSGGALIAKAEASVNGEDCFIAITEEDDELLLVCPYNSDPYVWRFSKMISDELTGRQVNIKKRIVSITFPQLEDTPENLNHRLKHAIEAEEYLLAAHLRDKLKKNQ